MAKKDTAPVQGATAGADTVACPQCGDAMRGARPLTDADYAKTFDREEPGVMAHGADTASPAQRAKIGALYRCTGCGYQTRVGGERDERDDT